MTTRRAATWHRPRRRRARRPHPPRLRGTRPSGCAKRPPTAASKSGAKTARRSDGRPAMRRRRLAGRGGGEVLDEPPIAGVTACAAVEAVGEEDAARVKAVEDEGRVLGEARGENDELERARRRGEERVDAGAHGEVVLRRWQRRVGVEEERREDATTTPPVISLNTMISTAITKCGRYSRRRSHHNAPDSYLRSSSAARTISLSSVLTWRWPPRPCGCTAASHGPRRASHAARSC